MKRIAFCFDGSWNKLHAENPTNVVLMAESITPTATDGTAQVVYYDEGVGTGKADTVRGGAFGVGLVTNLREAYRFLIFNFEPGDEIFIFGFSRGAFTARSFAGLIRHIGILDVNNANQINKAFDLYIQAMSKDGDDHPTALRFRAKHSSEICVSKHDELWRCENIDGFEKGSAPILKIKYVGVWDTVASLGWPNILPFATWLNKRFGFHDVKLTSKVQSARHALAIDERRKLFRPTVWNNVADLNSKKDISPYSSEAPYQQKWFPGVHGSVGGGGPIRQLSDSPLAWILSGAKRAGLEVNVEESSRVYEINIDPLASLQNNPKRVWHDWFVIGSIKRLLTYGDREGPSDANDVSASARTRWKTPSDELPEGKEYRPGTLDAVASELNEPLTFGGIEIKSALEHVVAKGESLSEIAGRYLDDIHRHDEVFQANRDVIDDPRDVHQGMRLKIPPK